MKNNIILRNLFIYLFLVGGGISGKKVWCEVQKFWKLCAQMLCVYAWRVAYYIISNNYSYSSAKTDIYFGCFYLTNSIFEYYLEHEYYVFFFIIERVIYNRAYPRYLRIGENHIRPCTEWLHLFWQMQWLLLWSIFLKLVSCESIHFSTGPQ